MDNVECFKVGRNIFKRGGLVIDVVVVIIFCVGVINMYFMGIGGGGFMLVYDSYKWFVEMIDFWEIVFEKFGIDVLKGDLMNGIRGNI